MFSSPLLVAVVSALFGTALGAGVQGNSSFNVEKKKSEATLNLERMRFEFSLVQGAFEGIDQEESAKQLKFIADSDVITHLNVVQLRDLAETPEDIPIIRRPSSARFAPDAAGFIYGFDETAKNIRANPGIDSPVVFKIDPGERVALLDTATDTSGFTGYKVALNEEEQIGLIASHLVGVDVNDDLPSAIGTRRGGGAR